RQRRADRVDRGADDGGDPLRGTGGGVGGIRLSGAGGGWVPALRCAPSGMTSLKKCRHPGRMRGSATDPGPTRHSAAPYRLPLHCVAPKAVPPTVGAAPMDVAARIRTILDAEAEAIRSIRVDDSFARALDAM